METRLQSSEVRLPKNDSSDNFDFNGHNKSASSCQYFKSSFARSLSFNTNQSQSLDFELSFRISKNNCDSPSAAADLSDLDGSTSSNTIKDDLNSSSYLSSQTSSVSPPASFCGSVAPSAINKDHFTKMQTTISSTPKRRYISNNSRTLQDSKNKSFSSEIEVLRLRKECQSLIEENRRLIGANRNVADIDDYNNCGNIAASVEETILQTKIDTLQWQLKQVESSRQMYHAVMEEVVRFLERCHQSLDAIQLNQISRSKSVSHVYQQQPSDDSIEHKLSTTRMRTSTLASSNLMMMMSNNKMHSNSSNGLIDTNSTSPIDSYTNFRDFTWRRSPKHCSGAPQSPKESVELEPEKLSQEAFRLLRTVQNLISLKEPVLNTDDESIKSASNQTLQKSMEYKAANASALSTIQRKLNLRESRLSIQSSTDDSVHSTSSSRNETDEELMHPATSQFCIHPKSSSSSTSSASSTASSATTNRKDLVKSVASSFDDESGFSSLNSFQEIGLPNVLPVASRLSSSSDKSMDSSQEPTIIVTNGNESFTNLNISKSYKSDKPLPIIHRRWSSAPPIPPKRNLSTFNPNSGNDEALKVLWV